MDAIGPMSRAVAGALEALEAPPTDAGAVELAKRYAALIDDATVAAKYREPLAGLRRTVDAMQDPIAARYLDKVADALAAHSVASDLGPKLLAALTALGMTVAGRGTKPGGDQSGPRVPDQLARLRAERGAR